MTSKLDRQCFEPFLHKANPDWIARQSIRMLVFDPGETTGAAFFNGGVLTWANQFATKDRTNFHGQFDALVEYLKPNFVLYEEYRVYSWRREQHAWADLHTPKLIGHIEAMCALRNIPSWSQMAHQAKHFCTDEKLHEWGLYIKSMKHSRDAIRHGCYFLMFGKVVVPIGS